MVLLKIEIFPAPAVLTEPQSLEPIATHFACLAASAASSSSGDNKEGRIWSLGRKQGDYCASADKSVSREHVILSVATANKTLLDT